MANKLLKKENLGKLIDALNNEGSIFVAPTMDARQVVYAPVAKAEEIVFDYIIPRNSFKEFLFPQTEPVATFTIGKEGVDLRSVEVNPKETVIFGSRPCDAATKMNAAILYGNRDLLRHNHKISGEFAFARCNT